MTETEIILRRLREFESRNITYLERRAGWPIVWQRARGTRVWDADGRPYLDLTAAFAVAAAGHANPRVVKAGQRQMATLLHAMGDVHPHALKAELARQLSRLTFERWSRTPGGGDGPLPGAPRARSGGKLPLSSGRAATRSSSGRPGRLRGKTIYGNSGFEAVEAALKTALLASGRPGVIAFHGAYHGLGYGALNATHRDFFRAPFLPQLVEFGHFLPFPKLPGDLGVLEGAIDRLFRRQPIGAVLVEPVQGRGGINVPPPGFLPLLRRGCDAHGAVLIVDEIFTGFGRTGRWFACEHAGTIPDLICLGKALTGGFPLSACVGRADVMDAAWPASTGEAIHTSTFLGHPVGCAMALAQIAEIQDRGLVERSAALGERLLTWLERIAAGPAGPGESRAKRGLRFEVRGLGLMAGLELTERNGSPATRLAIRVVQEMLRRGYILLPEGEQANVISLTPPLTIRRADLERAVQVLEQTLTGAARGCLA
ncbi:MAG: aspartate aminotransferase family protein [Verrucomicrobia bacterium]|nr:aspartate aminotransferase family protein [Verrucomicrobiota bacterium]